MIVTGIGVTALAVGEPAGKGIVVIPLDALDAILAQERIDAVRMRAERTHVAQAVEAVSAAAAGIVNRRFQCQIVVVDAAEQGESFHGSLLAPASACAAGPSISELTLPQMVP